MRRYLIKHLRLLTLCYFPVMVVWITHHCSVCAILAQIQVWHGADRMDRGIMQPCPQSFHWAVVLCIACSAQLHITSMLH